MNRQPDLNAPRFRKDNFNIFSDKEFKKNLNTLKLSKKYNIIEMKNIIKTFNETVWENVIDNRDGVKLPENLGILFVGTCQPKRKSKNVDFKSTVDYNKVIQHRNWESDDYLAKIFCTTFHNKRSVKNRELWSFKASRNFSRSVSKAYPSNWNMYHKIDPNKQISYLFEMAKIELTKNAENERLLEVYNEFEFLN